MSPPQILLSRRVLHQIKPKYPLHFTPPKSSSSSKKGADETPWPKWMQMVGYGSVAAAIPYTIGVTVKESRSLRDYLEGDASENSDGDSGSMGRKIVNAVRWYWGEEDEIPYVEYLKKKEKSTSSDNDDKVEISFANEDKTTSRLNEDRIERDCGSDINVSIECDGMVVQDDLLLKGKLPLGVQLISENGKIATTSKNIIVSVQDDDGSGSGSGTSSGNEVLPLLNDTVGELSTSSSSSADKDIGNLCTIYSTWNYFSPEMINASTENAPSIGTTKSSSSSFDSTQLRIEELQYNIDELQKSLMDPSCTRDRDDMESEIKQMKNEIGFLNRERRMAKFKRLLPF
eukprot:CAMPEP_0203676034 /NCGR_PEP_ID=MMETSP0090-20130426/22998_1 /ASSEMBLY_ACC=CAM_ASM_001088 /TAXON_ID=426623 /ORGANISM="Chaetoceros affinis, Strain CCMP159" /LENGTH=343 /DNA_ID=CAMNT_0050542427 /DNA_START=82 /DNA_END=1113 /DNA_ORIENTATION=+